MKIKSWIAFGLMFACSVALAQGEPYREGVHYAVIDQAPVQRDYVEVVEAFSYLCSHCATFEPYMQNWKKNMPEHVQLKRISVGFGRRAWELYSRGYITASLMGIEEESHLAMMDAVWKERKQMRSLDDMGDFYAQFGVEKDTFMATAQSFNVDTQMRREQMLIRQYGVNATPTMVVNGKYRISASEEVRGFDAMLDVVDYLVGKELIELLARKGADPSGSAAAAD